VLVAGRIVWVRNKVPDGKDMAFDSVIPLITVSTFTALNTSLP
jgi:hypothetical protein